MRRTFQFRFAGILIMLAMIAVFGVAVMLLWNALLPGLFGLPALNYWQAAGILLLVRILAGGLGHGFASGAFFRGHGHGNKLREKWMNMSEEERMEFIKKERGFAGFQDRFSHFNRFFDDDQGKKEKDNE